MMAVQVPVVCARRIECQSALGTLWSLLTDTDALNQAAGLQRVRATPMANESAARYLVSTRLGGFDVEYEELPFEWVYHESFRVQRRMHNGPLRDLKMVFALRALALGGTEVQLTTRLTPRSRVLAPLVQLRGWQSLRDLGREVRRLDRALVSGVIAPPPRRSVHVHENMLGRGLHTLKRDATAELIRRLETLLREGSDLQVARLRPFALADAWSASRRDVLRLCLRAALANLLAMHWEVICPSCRTGTQAAPSLDDVVDHAFCHMCDLKFVVDMHDAVELVFAPHEQVRRFEQGPYCIGGPARTPHVVSQCILPRHGMVVMRAPNNPGTYHVFVRGGAGTTIKVTPRGLPALELSSDALSNMSAPELAPGAAIMLHSAADRDLHAKIERYEWASQAATARDVLSLSEYREHFQAPAVG